MSQLEASIAALRAAGDGDHAALASTTRTRVQRSLARRARGRQRLMQSSLVAGVLLVSTLSWAWSTGRLSLRPSAPEPVVAPTAPESAPVPRPAPKASQLRTAAAPAIPPAVTEPENKPSAPRTPRKPATVGGRPAVLGEVLYRSAHELHFRGGDPATALAAWDAYLAAEATGRFAIEARYNRGLLLARLGRYAEAREALAPYSAGEVLGGYRRTEARAIIDRLDQLAPVNETAGSGD